MSAIIPKQAHLVRPITDIARDHTGRNKGVYPINKANAFL